MERDGKERGSGDASHGIHLGRGYIHTRIRLGRAATEDPPHHHRYGLAPPPNWRRRGLRRAPPAPEDRPRVYGDAPRQACEIGFTARIDFSHAAGVCLPRDYKTDPGTTAPFSPFPRAFLAANEPPPPPSCVYIILYTRTRRATPPPRHEGRRRRAVRRRTDRRTTAREGTTERTNAAPSPPPPDESSLNLSLGRHIT